MLCCGVYLLFFALSIKSVSSCLSSILKTVLSVSNSLHVFHPVHLLLGTALVKLRLSYILDERAILENNRMLNTPKSDKTAEVIDEY